MASAPLALTEAYRVSQAGAAANVVAQAAIAYKSLLSPADLDGSFARYLATQHLLIGNGRRVTATIAGAYYDAHRTASGVKGKAQIHYADPVELGRTATSLLYTGPVTVKKSISKGRTLEAAMRAGQAATLGAVFRLVADGGRETVSATMRSDGYVLGYARVTDGDPCAFCAMLASRGFVYKDESTADEAYHDGCGCCAQPTYAEGDNESLSPKSQEFADLWAESTGDAYGKDKITAFRRAYEAQR